MVRYRPIHVTSQSIVSTARAAAGVLALGAVMIAGAGCQFAGYMAKQIEENKEIDIPAQYSGLYGERVAILIDAPMDIMYEYPGAYEELTAMITYNLPRFLNGEYLDEKEQKELKKAREEMGDAAPPRTTTVPAQVILSYQNSNVYWANMDYAQLARDLNATRLVLIDLVEYRLNAPGNSYLWDGLIRADVHVVEANSFDPSSFAFSTAVDASFPTVDGVSRDNAAPGTIHQGLRVMFAERVLRLFYDHTRINRDLMEEQRRG